jgi:hypothetical protein
MTVLFAVKGYKAFKFRRHILNNNGNSTVDVETGDVFNQCLNLVGLRKKITLKVCGYVKTPLVIGIFKPVVIFPDAEMTADEKRLAFTHELTHIKNRDLLFKFFAFCIPIIHWYNPLAYLLCRKVYEISELHCDEQMVKTMTQAERKSYGNLILKSISEISAFQASVCSTLSTKTRNIERRLLNMMKFKKSRKSIFVLSLVVALVFTSLGAVYALAVEGNSSDLAMLPQYGFVITQNDKNATANEIQESYVGKTSVATEYEEVANVKYDMMFTSANVLSNASVSSPHATLPINVDIPANTTATNTTPLPMEVGETIRVNITYSPSSANLDVGILQPDGSFRFVMSSNGSVDHTFTINQRGTHYLRIRNNSSNTVTVLGFVTY